MGVDGIKRIAPVYDNGNCLNCKWDEKKMLEVLSDEKRLETEAYRGRRCIFEFEGERVNPYHTYREHGICRVYGSSKKAGSFYGDCLGRDK